MNIFDAVPDCDPVWNRMLSLANKRNIVVNIVDGMFSTILGFYWKDEPSIETIAICTTTIKAGTRNFTMAHELAHAKLHSRSGDSLNMFSTDNNKKLIAKQEQEADKFAERLLRWISFKEKKSNIKGWC